jgi:hypothetical protein
MRWSLRLTITQHLPSSSNSGGSGNGNTDAKGKYYGKGNVVITIPPTIGIIVTLTRRNAT